MSRSCRRRVWLWGLGAWALTDDHRAWRLAYLRPTRDG